MKRTFVAFLVLGLVAGGLASAQAGKKPTKTTLYLHGVNQFGEVDGVDNLANAAPPMQMTTAAPDASAPRSMTFGLPLNRSCVGSPGFPTWEARGLSGTIVGDVKMNLHAVTRPTQVMARLWIDVPAGGCNEAFVAPLAEVMVDTPAGHGEVEIVFPDIKQKATFNMIIQILGPAQTGRVLYDSADMASAVTFGCIPASGKGCI